MTSNPTPVLPGRRLLGAVNHPRHDVSARYPGRHANRVVDAMHPGRTRGAATEVVDVAGRALLPRPVAANIHAVGAGMEIR